MSPSKLHCTEGGRSVEYLPFKNGDVGLHAVAAGPEDGPVVVLLHGFPEFWYSWHRQIEPLSAAGFRVIVPDQRGYNLSSKPVGVSSYAMPELVSDVIAIADQLGQRKIFLADTIGAPPLPGAPPCCIRSASPSSSFLTSLTPR